MLGAKDAQVCGMSARARTSAHAGMRSSARKHVCNHTHKHASNHARGHANNRAHVCQQSCIQACTRACMKVCAWPVHVWSTSIDFCLLTYLDSWGPSYQISRFSLLYSCGPHGCRANPRSPLFHCSSQRSNGLTEGHFHHKNPTSVFLFWSHAAFPQFPFTYVHTSTFIWKYIFWIEFNGIFAKSWSMYVGSSNWSYVWIECPQKDEMGGLYLYPLMHLIYLLLLILFMS